MKKGIVLGLVFLLVMMSFTSISGNKINNQIVKTSCRGSILYVGGSGEGNYSKIQDAIDDAFDGDTVFVYDDSSPYCEQVHVYKRINFIGENRNTTVINGEDYLYTVAICEDANNVLISGFTITGSDVGIGSSTGISIGVNNNVIQGNKIVFNHYGIRIYGDADNNIIDNNLILHNSIVGVYDDHRDSENTVKWNVIGGNGRENPDYREGGLFKHHSGGNFHHNDIEMNWGANAYTENSYWGVWDDGSEGNYWDNWEGNPGYPNEYIIRGTVVDQIDRHPSATRYLNHPIVCISPSYDDRVKLSCYQLSLLS